MQVVKKDGTIEDFNKDKIIKAVKKAVARSMCAFNDYDLLVSYVRSYLNGDIVSVDNIHDAVIKALNNINVDIAKSYSDYRNYKADFVHMLDEVYTASQSIRFIGDKENSNTDSALVATKRCLIFNELNKRLYRKFFMTASELSACKDGYIYIHDQSARLDTMNCCLFDVASVMRGGFEMGNIYYNEPKTLDTAFDVMGDIILSCASQQYGGFTVAEVDKILSYYANKSFIKYCDELQQWGVNDYEKIAMQRVKRDFEQGFQGIEMKLNTVGSSRGDYPFITMTFGIGQDKFAQLASETFLKVHMKGQGKKGFEKPVLFPKLVFLYDENLHGVGKPLRHLYDVAIECSSKTMYPDWLSLSGEGYVPSIYKKYHKVVSPMGCRAFLSPWFDENGEAVFVGRFNIGAVSLNLPMILAKSRKEDKDFYEVLDYYLEMIRNIHKRTYDYLGELKASVNPVGFCEGGFYGGHLKPTDKIKPLLKPMTASFGITALNELQQLYNSKSLVEDGNFALEVLDHINMRVEQFKKADGWLYAIYGTPAESLCGKQVEQFRKLYGIVHNVSDRPYVSNSFHCHVSEQISPIIKQDCEGRFWDLCNGGKIQYVRYPLGYNVEAMKTLIDRAMKKGFYGGVNLALSYCDDCGYQQLEMDICPVCGSKNITKIDRMNGYLSYSRIKGDTRLNSAKMAEIHDRISM